MARKSTVGRPKHSTVRTPKHSKDWHCCYATRKSTVGRPKHSKYSHCYYSEDVEIWTSPLSKSYFSGVQSQNMSSTAASSRSWNSISSIVTHKMISIRANVGFSQHGYFSEKNSKSIARFLNC